MKIQKYQSPSGPLVYNLNDYSQIANEFKQAAVQRTTAQKQKEIEDVIAYNLKWNKEHPDNPVHFWNAEQVRAHAAQQYELEHPVGNDMYGNDQDLLYRIRKNIANSHTAADVAIGEDYSTANKRNQTTYVTKPYLRDAGLMATIPLTAASVATVGAGATAAGAVAGAIGEVGGRKLGEYIDSALGTNWVTPTLSLAGGFAGGWAGMGGYNRALFSLARNGVNVDPLYNLGRATYSDVFHDAYNVVKPTIKVDPDFLSEVSGNVYDNLVGGTPNNYAYTDNSPLTWKSISKRPREMQKVFGDLKTPDQLLIDYPNATINPYDSSTMLINGKIYPLSISSNGSAWINLPKGAYGLWRNPIITATGKNTLVHQGDMGVGPILNPRPTSNGYKGIWWEANRGFYPSSKKTYVIDEGFTSIVPSKPVTGFGDDYSYISGAVDLSDPKLNFRFIRKDPATGLFVESPVVTNTANIQNPNDLQIFTSNFEKPLDFFINDTKGRMAAMGHNVYQVPPKYTVRSFSRNDSYDNWLQSNGHSNSGAWFSPISNDITFRGNINNQDYGLSAHEIAGHWLRYNSANGYKPITRDATNKFIEVLNENGLNPKEIKIKGVKIPDTQAQFTKAELDILDDAYRALNYGDKKEWGAVNTQLRAKVSERYGNVLGKELNNKINEDDINILNDLYNQPYTTDQMKYEIHDITGCSWDDVEFLTKDDLAKIYDEYPELQDIIAKVKKAMTSVGTVGAPVTVGMSNANDKEQSQYNKQGGILKRVKHD